MICLSRALPGDCNIILMYVITDQGEHEKTISVLLNGVESTVEFLDGIEIQVHTDVPPLENKTI